MTETFLTVTEVADQLGVDPETVRRWVRVGRMRALALSRRSGYRISIADFETFLEERTGRRLKELERERA